MADPFLTGPIPLPMDSFRFQRRVLQTAVAAAAVVPALAGLWGVMTGLGVAGAVLDSQHRFLSGLQLAIGLGLWWCVPNLLRRAGPFRLLCLLIVAGGLGRLGAALADGFTPLIGAAVVFELVVTPVLFFWRERVERMDPDAPSRYGGPWG